MIDPHITTGASGAAHVAPIAGQRSGVDAPATLGGARFQALLEALDLRSQNIAKAAQEPLSAESLPAAVKDARASMEDALELGKSLLEALRQDAAQSTRLKR